MSFEQRLRDDLHTAPVPADLVPPVGLADAACERARRGHRTLLGVAGVAAAAALAVGVPWAVLGPGFGFDERAPVSVGAPAEPDFPSPGGGPTVVRVYRTDTTSWVLDPDTGRYVKVPLWVTLSPDGAQAAVTDGDRVGVADRATLLRDGEKAVRWLPLPPGSPPSWSPDGRALLVTSIDKTADTVAFTAHRYEVGTRAVTDTPVRVSMIGSAVGWAADSRRYVAWLRGAETRDTVEPGALQYLNPDGTPGPRVPITGGTVDGADTYSPSRRSLAADASDVMAASPVRSPVVDVATGDVIGTLPTGVRPVGWRDEDSVVVLARDGTTLSVLTARTGGVEERVQVAAVPGLVGVQVGPSAGLTGPAARRGF